MKLPRIDKVNVSGKKVLVRAPFDVPLSGSKISDDSRIKSALPTINYLLDGGAAIVLISKLGRPDGKRVKSLSLGPVAKHLSKLIGRKIIFCSEAIGPKAEKAKNSLKPGEILLLENLRFYKGEEENDRHFAKKLAEGCEIFIFEDFPNAKNDHAGITGVAKLLPTYAGLNFANEVENITKFFEKPAKPVVAVVGGAKISTKIDILKGIIEKVDVLILGGGMANTFLVAEGYDIGKSLYEEDYLDSAEEINRLCEDEGVELLLPDDVLVAKRVRAHVRALPKAVDEVNKNEIIVDIGPKSVAKFAEPLKFAGTIFWNGPIGIAEYRNFSKGTEAIAKIISASKSKSIIGGGDTVAALEGGKYRFDFVSTGGGATLELVAGEKLPAVEMFQRRSVNSKIKAPNNKYL
jgi:phosphoglycerate kinase